MDDRESVAEPVLRVLIVDPDPRLRRGLRALLETQPDMVVMGEADSADEALRRAAALAPSIVLLDLKLPTVQDGLETIRLLAAHRRPCLAISWHSSLREAALEAGAGGFVEKGASPRSLLAALRSAGRAEDAQGAARLPTEVPS